MRRSREPSSIAVALTGAAAVVVFVAGIAAVFNDEEEVPVAGARIQLDGTALRLGGGGDHDELSDGDVLQPGDRVVITGGSAVFELAGGGSVEGRAAFGDGVEDTTFTVGAPMELLAGDALVSGPAGVAVEAAGTVVTLEPPDGNAAARIRRDLAVTTATYRGRVEVDSVGQRRDVPALRQLGVSSIGRPGSSADPLVYDPADPWDLRYLAAAIDASRQLDTLARSFTAQGIARTSATDYEQLLEPLARERAFDGSFIDPDRAPGDTLVGAAIAVLGGDGSFAERWGEVFGFRSQGAEWGLVVLDQGVTEEAVIDLVTDALERSLRPGGTPEVAAPVTVPSSPTSPVDRGEPSGGATTTTTAPPTTTTTAPPVEQSPPATLLPPLPPIDLPGLPPISIPTLPPLRTDPRPNGGLLDGLLQPVADVLRTLVGPGGLLDAG